jgi:trans-2,3-dihydro-3-hydroxyanthranilate isomerase
MNGRQNNMKETKLPFYWIDVFTKQKLSGNPCAVILNADSLSSEQMQSIAKEINLSETAFVISSQTATFGARYFTPTGELPFAGHPTIATIYTLIHAGVIKMEEPITKVSLELPAGVIPIEIALENGKHKIIMSQLTPKFQRVYDTKDICQIYGLTSDDLLPGVPIQTVNTGTPILMIPLANHDALKRARYMDFDHYLKLKDTGDFYFPHHFCIEGATSHGTTFARSLGTPENPLEDPFTGSATGCMAAYLWKYGLISSPLFIAEQGHWMGRPGEALVEVIGSKDSISTIRIAGEAVCLIVGSIDLR